MMAGMHEAMQHTRWPGRLGLLALVFASFVGGCRAAVTSDDVDRIVSVRWELVAIEAPEGELQPAPEHRPSLVFHAPTPDGEEPLPRIAGDGGCNRFWGYYRLLGKGELAFSSIASTRMACASERSILEQVLLDALSGATRYEVVDSALTIHASDTKLYFRGAGTESAETDAR